MREHGTEETRPADAPQREALKRSGSRRRRARRSDTEAARAPGIDRGIDSPRPRPDSPEGAGSLGSLGTDEVRSETPLKQDSGVPGLPEFAGAEPARGRAGIAADAEESAVEAERSAGSRRGSALWETPAASAESGLSDFADSRSDHTEATAVAVGTEGIAVGPGNDPVVRRPSRRRGRGRRDKRFAPRGAQATEPTSPAELPDLDRATAEPGPVKSAAVELPDVARQAPVDSEKLESIPE